MKILITGGAGYIGSVLAPHLLRAGHDVTVLDNFLFGQATLLDCCRHDNFQVVRGDCRSEAVMKPLLAKADAVIPLAALVGAPMCANDPVGAQTINQDAIEMLCRLASPDQRILMPVTNSGYGIGEKGKMCTGGQPAAPDLPVRHDEGRRREGGAGAAQRPHLPARHGLRPLAAHAGRPPGERFRPPGGDRPRGRHLRGPLQAQLHPHPGRGPAFAFALDNFERMKGQAYNAGLEDANLSKLELCAEIRKHLPKFTFLEAPVGEDPDSATTSSPTSACSRPASRWSGPSTRASAS